MSPRTLTFAAWAALACGLAACEIAARASHGRLPTVAHAAATLLSRPAGRYPLILAWMWLGWHLFAR